MVLFAQVFSNKLSYFPSLFFLEECLFPTPQISARASWKKWIFWLMSQKKEGEHAYLSISLWDSFICSFIHSFFFNYSFNKYLSDCYFLELILNARILRSNKINKDPVLMVYGARQGRCQMLRRKTEEGRGMKYRSGRW